MEEITNEDLSNQLTRSFSKTKRKRFLTQCSVCEAPATYAYVGVIVCSPCKIFFKRNAQKKRDKLKCHFSGHCLIKPQSRHQCASCRLEKCFASGMQVDLLRGPIGKKRKPNSQPTTKMIISSYPLQHVLRLSFQSNHSMIATDQWMLLSNLSHCYDENSRLYLAEQFLQEQNKLPMKMRYKCANVHKLLQSFIAGAQLLFEKNHDFLSLSIHDRSVLLQNTMKQVGGLSVSCILDKSNLYDNERFYESVAVIYGPMTIATARQASQFLGLDLIVIKLVLAMLIFSPFDYIYYNGKPATYLENTKAVVEIQNRCIELLWRYLLYKYDHRRAISCFSNLIRSLFAINSSIIAALDVQQYHQIIDSLVKQTEQSLNKFSQHDDRGS